MVWWLVSVSLYFPGLYHVNLAFHVLWWYIHAHTRTLHVVSKNITNVSISVVSEGAMSAASPPVQREGRSLTRGEVRARSSSPRPPTSAARGGYTHISVPIEARVKNQRVSELRCWFRELRGRGDRSLPPFKRGVGASLFQVVVAKADPALIRFDRRAGVVSVIEGDPRDRRS